MALAPSLLTADAKLSIERAGFYLIKDEETGDAGQRRGVGKGRRFARFYDAGYRTKTPEGLDFVIQNTIGDPDIGGIIKSIIKHPRWGYLRFYSDILSSDYAWFFHIRDRKNDHEAIHTLQVQFWMPGSRAIFYAGSQLQSFEAGDPEKWGILRAPVLHMERNGIVKTVEDMPNGGYTIIDSRLGWTCDKGKFMNIGFGTEDEVRSWDKMPLPDTVTLKAKVAELEAHGFRTNFTFEQYQQSLDKEKEAK
ncbi:hypothetical protein NUW58_g2134 [Xylaria curta]|uniref:Uncharacterized protein n=1 Tax=Xylaria curta TaxID=42375 RepID=A0ACC1PIS1_9PEZI|nr:hypothetical protein NUW58_g2134 [Xylaria curta]